MFVQEDIILVDENDLETGFIEKMEAHRKGLLHRAFSIFIYNDKGEWLLHQRADNKYHSPGLWTNTCCGHPRKGENTGEAALRRLNEEMGFNCPIRKIFDFTYFTDFGNGLFEHELDYVYAGNWNGNPKPNTNEAQKWKWENPKNVIRDIEENPENYTYWFRLIAEKAHEFIGE